MDTRIAVTRLQQSIAVALIVSDADANYRRDFLQQELATLDAAGLVPGSHLVRYLNRLADLLWVLARAAEQAEHRTATPSRPERSRRSGRTSK